MVENRERGRPLAGRGVSFVLVGAVWWVLALGVRGWAAAGAVVGSLVDLVKRLHRRGELPVEMCSQCRDWAEDAAQAQHLLALAVWDAGGRLVLPERALVGGPQLGSAQVTVVTGTRADDLSSQVVLLLSPEGRRG